MSVIIRVLFPLIGYVCVATVITAILGYGYLRSQGKLDDEQLFRLVALLHEIDLEKVGQSQQTSTDEVPAEESSYEERQSQRAILLRHFEAKQEDLESNMQNFNYRLVEVKEATVRYDAVRQAVRNYLQEQNKRIMQAGPASVRAQLEKMDPKKQAKPILLKMIEENKMNDVIMLLESMKSKNRDAILDTFTDEKELETLLRIQSQMLSGKPIKPKIDEAIETLNQLNEQANN